MKLRPFNPQTDTAAVRRIWKECGWATEEKYQEAMDDFLAETRSLVGEVNGEAECLVTSARGSIRHLKQDLRLAAVTGVTTSYVARKQGLAQRLTARLVAEDAADGAEVSALGIFEQGFYNKLGYGTGSYENIVCFDPAELAVPVTAGIPRRLSCEDWEEIHQARLSRQRGHGSCNIDSAVITRGEMRFTKGGFGLGFGTPLTHFIWCEPKGGAGPYSIDIIAWRNREQLLELMALIRNLGDQVSSVRMLEPACIHIQNMLRQPFRHQRLTENSKHQSSIRAYAKWQIRLCDIESCLAKTSLPGGDVRFGLTLTDPVEKYLDEDQPWRGVAGEYVITIGRESSAERGSDDSLPHMTATVNAFSRLWLGVLPASGLAIVEELEAPESLLESLDDLLRLPAPRCDWDF